MAINVENFHSLDSAEGFSRVFSLSHLCRHARPCKLIKIQICSSSRGNELKFSRDFHHRLTNSSNMPPGTWPKSTKIYWIDEMFGLESECVKTIKWMKTYVIWFHIMLDNKQQIFRVSLHFAHISSLVSFHHPSPHWSLLFRPRINHYSVNVYCFVFINKNATTNWLRNYGHTIQLRQWHESSFDHFACKCRLGSLKVNDHPANARRCRSSNQIQETEIHHVFPLWQQRGH